MPTTAQIQAALSRAQHVRLARSDDKRRIAADQLAAGALLRLPPDHWDNAPAMDVLLSINRVGTKRAHVMLKAAGIHDEHRRLIDLSKRQRHHLADQADQAQHVPLDHLAIA